MRKIQNQTTDEDNEACIFDGEFNLVVVIDAGDEKHDQWAHNTLKENHHDTKEAKHKAKQQETQPTRDTTTSKQTSLQPLINLPEEHNTHSKNTSIQQPDNINWLPKTTV